MVLGQDQDAVQGGYEKEESLSGSLAEIRMWSREVQGQVQYCWVGLGRVWIEGFWGYLGPLQVQPPLCIHTYKKLRKPLIHTICTEVFNFAETMLFTFGLLM